MRSKKARSQFSLHMIRIKKLLKQMQEIWNEKTNQNNECEKKTEDGNDEKVVITEEELQMQANEK